MGHLSSGMEGCAHEGNLHAHRGEGKIPLTGRRHKVKCAPCPCPATGSVHIQLQTCSTLGSWMFVRTALKCLWPVLCPAVSLCAGDAAQAWVAAPNTSPSRKCRQWMELPWSRGQKTRPVPARVQRGLASVNEPCTPITEAVYHMPYGDACRLFSSSSFSSGSLQTQMTYLPFPTYFP